MQAYLAIFLFLVSAALSLLFFLIVALAIRGGRVGVNGTPNPTFTWSGTRLRFAFTVVVYFAIGCCFAFFAYHIFKSVLPRLTVL